MECLLVLAVVQSGAGAQRALVYFTDSPRVNIFFAPDFSSLTCVAPLGVNRFLPSTYVTAVGVNRF